MFELTWQQWLVVWLGVGLVGYAPTFVAATTVMFTKDPDKVPLELKGAVDGYKLATRDLSKTYGVKITLLVVISVVTAFYVRDAILWPIALFNKIFRK